MTHHVFGDAPDEESCQSSPGMGRNDNEICTMRPGGLHDQYGRLTFQQLHGDVRQAGSGCRGACAFEYVLAETFVALDRREGIDDLAIDAAYEKLLVVYGDDDEGGIVRCGKPYRSLQGIV
jgi:hypothetical protein